MLKRLFVLLLLLGVAGAVVYAVRARRASESVPGGGRHGYAEDGPTAPPMRVREAGSATA
jgi:hypothetical protein